MSRKKAKFSAKMDRKIQKQSDFKNRRKEFKSYLRKGGKSCSVLLKNLPFSVGVNDIKTYFKKFGDVCDVKLTTKKGGKLTGNGFVHFKSVDAAETAINECSGKDFMGRKLHVEWAMPLSDNGKLMIKSEEENSEVKSNLRNVAKEEINQKMEDDIVEDEEEGSEDQDKVHVKSQCKVERPSQQSNSKVETTTPVQSNAKKRRGRIIVRNIAFKATEEKLMDHFKEFGAISEVVLLKRNDGKLVGCGFVQFENKKSAIKAIMARNNTPFLGRPIICDWALPNDKYLKFLESEMKQEKKEKETFEDIQIKEEPCSDESEIETQIKMETEQDSENDEQEEDSDNDIDDDNEDYDDDDDDDDSEIDEQVNSGGVDKKSQRSKKFSEESEREKKPKVISNDVSQGCTVFVKNIPFSATNEDLRKCMKQFGPLEYALVCIDDLTEHSKGTGFVKFKNKDDAEKCLQAGELMLQDQNIEVLKALARNDIKNMDETKKKKTVKDSRHLYLVKEGVIIAGSSAAKDVSVTDMEKRLKLEQWKTQMLRNLNMFVSNTRLIIYNVPPAWTDAQVRQLFKEHAGLGATIKEARIMRDMRNLDPNGVGKSKEFAFVHFTQHEHALRALRNVNNNPNIFTNNKRPIVSFSIENKAIHKIKQKRLQKSVMVKSEKQNQSAAAATNVKHKGGDNSKNRGNKHKSTHPKSKTEFEVESNTFSGLEGKPGIKNMRTKFKLRTQAEMHLKNAKADKRKQKIQKEIKNRLKSRHREPKPKKQVVAEKDSFNKLVNQYKMKLTSADARKRWYE